MENGKIIINSINSKEEEIKELILLSINTDRTLVVATDEFAKELYIASLQQDKDFKYPITYFNFINGFYNTNRDTLKLLIHNPLSLVQDISVLDVKHISFEVKKEDSSIHPEF